ncbi:MAG: SH3 domain-containing protein, partial [Chloroflexota bacterium]
RTIGQAIQIYVPEDGYLNMRAEPSLTAGVVTLLQSGTRGTIIAGPESRDGYIWWQISVGSQTGWMVESLEDSLALIPPQLIPSITPTPTQTAVP